MMTLEALENCCTSWTCGIVCFQYILLLNVIIYFLQKIWVASKFKASLISFNNTEFLVQNVTVMFRYSKL